MTVSANNKLTFKEHFSILPAKENLSSRNYFLIILLKLGTNTEITKEAFFLIKTLLIKLKAKKLTTATVILTTYLFIIKITHCSPQTNQTER